MRFFLEISYQGSQYHGWQKQHNAQGIQTVIEEALQKLLRQPVQVSGSGRTDTGVHACQQWAHFDAVLALVPENFLHRMNALLPRDIAVQSLWQVRETAHARFDAVCRSYEYHIHQEKSPFLNNLSYFFAITLDLERMNTCADSIADGVERDYRCFSKSGSSQDHHLCRIFSANWERTKNGRLIFRISANRFLRNMVRAIVGTLLEVGSGRMDHSDFEQILAGRDRRKAGRSVPAEGLYLCEVRYPQEIFLQKF